MQPWTLDLLACPSCRTPYALEVREDAAGEIVEGRLECTSCRVGVPITHGFPIFTMSSIAKGDPAPHFPSAGEYGAYRARKAERGEMEPYAAFFPFNESTRAADPVLPHFAAHLAAGDVILDPWSRTGWTALMLAGRFPEQRVVAMWEGDRSVLGHAGFDHWLCVGRKPANLEILFVHPEQGLPLRSASVAGLFAHDCWHRFSPASFWSEALRVTSPEAALMLVHTHLSNSEPDPWFDRGGTIRHGRDYRRWLDVLLAGDRRQARIWSELDLFGLTGSDPLPPDDPDTQHYNSLIFAGDLSRPARRAPEPAASDGLLLNPLFRLDLARRTATVDARLHDGLAGHLFDRHPGYLATLPADPVPLSPTDLVMLAVAVTGGDAGEVAAFGSEASFARLLEADLLLQVAVPPQAVALQRFHANQLPEDGAVDAFPATVGRISGAALCTPDGGEIAAPALQDVLGQLVAALRRQGVGPERALCCGISDHPLALAILLAGAACGADSWLSAPVSKGASLTIIEDGAVADVPGDCLRLGLDGDPGGLLGMALDLAPEGDMPPTGALVWTDVDGQRSLPIRRLIEAVLSWRSVTSPQPATLPELSHPADMLQALAALSHGEPVRVG